MQDVSSIGKDEAMSPYTLMRDADIEPIADAVFDVLGKIGLLCQNREMLHALERNGARVDYASDTATFPRPMCEVFLDQLRAEAPAAAAEPLPTAPLPSVGTQVAPFCYDYERREQRRGNRADLITLTKLGAMLHPEQPVGHSLLLTDTPPLVEPLEAAMVLAEYAPVPGPPFAWHVGQIDYLIEMGDILGLADWFTYGANCIAHPMRFDKDVADKFVRRVKEGREASITSMPVAGVTTPITVAGFIAVSAAEYLAVWLAGRALNPDAPLSGFMYAGTMDMRSGDVSYCAFDAMAYAFALAEFMLKWTGHRVKVGGGEYCDAKAPGYYAALEKAYKSMTIAAFTGRHPSTGQGLLAEGKMLCPVELLLEREMASGIGWYGRPAEVTPEAIDLDAILGVGFGLDRSYLDVESTARRFRECLWCPPHLDRSGWNGHDTDEAVLSRLRLHMNDLLAQYKKPEVDPANLAKMREVVERARKALVG